MVVLVILGMIAGAISFSVFNQQREASKRAARLDMQQLASAVEMYRLKHNGLPESLEQLVPGEVARIRADPWGNPFVFTHTGDAFQISSYGPDKAQGGGDDLSEESNPAGASRT
jgi:general secretion pathway protein G